MRNAIIAGTCLTLLALVGIGQHAMDKSSSPVGKASPVQSPPPPQETKPESVDSVINGTLQSIQEGDPVNQQAALGSLLDVLQGPEYAQAAIKPATSEEFAKAAVAVIESSETETTPELKTRLAVFLASKTRGRVSRDYVFKTLDEGGDDARKAVLEHLGSRDGIGGRKVFEKVQELASKGMIDEKTLPAVLRRTGGKKATEPITALMKSTDSEKVVSACVIALQDIGEAANLGPALERLEQIQVIDSPEHLPWISPKLFSQFMEKAEGPDMVRGIKVMRSRPSLVKSGLPALEKGLSAANPATRRAAAEAVKKAVVLKKLGAKRGEELLAGRLTIETEPVVKAELAGGLEQVRGMITAAEAQETKPN